MTKIGVFGPYLFGTCLDPDQEAKDRLFRLFEKTPDSSGKILEGRVRPVEDDIPGVGAVVVKHYRRGGMIRHFVKDTYVGFGKSRSRREYEMLETVRRLGVLSPEPLVWAIRGRLIYKAYLVTGRIEGHRSLSDMGSGKKEPCRVAVENAAGQIRLLIENRIYHVDLHPGNVLVDKEGKVYLIDFDKARRVTWRPEKLRMAYIKRWKRAVEKYSLPAFMTEQMIESLGSTQCH
jgi:3-deoxy-D-manno-octulosonic acid kinase